MQALARRLRQQASGRRLLLAAAVTVVAVVVAVGAPLTLTGLAVVAAADKWMW